MEKHLYLSLLVISLFIIGILHTNEGKLYNHIDNDAVADLAGGDYIRFVYIGSSTCPFSNNADTHDKIRLLKKILRISQGLQTQNLYQRVFLSTLIHI